MVGRVGMSITVCLPGYAEKACHPIQLLSKNGPHMAPVSRTALFSKIHKVLRKYYKPVAPPAERTVLEHLLFGCVLEDAHFEPAEEAFAALRHTFYDWNEVRVTSISELSEVMAVLPDPRAAGNRVKRILHSIFEELYCFDLEDKRKKNLGPTVKWLEKMDGTTRFVVAYVVQAALDGHSIPVDTGTMAVLQVLDLVSDKEAAAGEVPGMERAVGKSKGMEFGSLLHQLGVDYQANPFSAQVREILLAIDPEASNRFPQRRQPRPEGASSPGGEEGPASGAANEEAASSVAPRKKKGVAAGQAKPAAEGPAAEAVPGPEEDRPAEGKPAEAKKAASPSKREAEAAHESPAGEKSHEKAKVEKGKKVEKSERHAAPESSEHAERHVAPAETPHALPPSDNSGKRKPR